MTVKKIDCKYFCPNAVNLKQPDAVIPFCEKIIAEIGNGANCLRCEFYEKRTVKIKRLPKQEKVLKFG